MPKNTMIQLTGNSQSFVFFFKQVIPTNTDLISSKVLRSVYKDGRTEIGGTEILTGEDQHNETNGEKEGRNEQDQTGILRSEITRTTLNHLDDHRTKA